LKAPFRPDTAGKSRVTSPSTELRAERRDTADGQQTQRS
jgi:hypothetical protein